jgi:hypothetical protein
MRYTELARPAGWSHVQASRRRARSLRNEAIMARRAPMYIMRRNFIRDVHGRMRMRALARRARRRLAQRALARQVVRRLRRGRRPQYLSVFPQHVADNVMGFLGS